ncbi:hypothetical protein COCON_G00183210 [Conger conger]|uniref:Uncharacterized protein n=1 Tax=Conger conger TaxID=82655 RepID=A0A9Q1D620_CONCO|nr:hypothetical protein COCON_G00183210 [Conger conger]
MNEENEVTLAGTRMIAKPGICTRQQLLYCILVGCWCPTGEVQKTLDEEKMRGLCVRPGPINKMVRTKSHDWSPTSSLQGNGWRVAGHLLAEGDKTPTKTLMH